MTLSVICVVDNITPQCTALHTQTDNSRFIRVRAARRVTQGAECVVQRRIQKNGSEEQVYYMDMRSGASIGIHRQIVKLTILLQQHLLATLMFGTGGTRVSVPCDPPIKSALDCVVRSWSISCQESRME